MADLVWQTMLDSRVRPDHAAAHGQVAQTLPGWDLPVFTVGGYECNYPGDPTLPDDLRINCRCFTEVVRDGGGGDDDDVHPPLPPRPEITPDDPVVVDGDGFRLWPWMLLAFAAGYALQGYLDSRTLEEGGLPVDDLEELWGSPITFDVDRTTITLDVWDVDQYRFDMAPDDRGVLVVDWAKGEHAPFAADDPRHILADDELMEWFAEIGVGEVRGVFTGDEAVAHALAGWDWGVGVTPAMVADAMGDPWIADMALDDPKFPFPADVLAIGWKRGARSWRGRRIMMGRDWPLRRVLS